MVRASGLRVATIAILCGVLSTAGCRRSAPAGSVSSPAADPSASASPPASASSEPPKGVEHADTAKDVDHVRASFRHVNLHVDDTTILEIRRLEGELIGRSPGHPPAFDDEQSFTLAVRSAEIALSADSLTRLVNRALTAAESPLADVEI